MKPILLATAILTAAPFLPTAPATAAPRSARCVIESAGAPTFRGPCLFEADRGGSFTVTRPGGARFAGTITAISLAIISPGIGEVRGLTRDGANSRWGRARRSKSDRACWVGSEFRMCVY